MEKKIRKYITPKKRADQKMSIEKRHTKIYNSTPFFNSLFENNDVGKIYETIYILNDKLPRSIIKSWIPYKFLNEKYEQIDDLEKYVDKEFKAELVNKELMVSYPTDKEKEILKLDSNYTFIEKIYILNENNQVIRYEEEVSVPDYYRFEDTP